MTDDQYVKMSDGKVVIVKQKSCPVRTALHTYHGNGVSSFTSLVGRATKDNEDLIRLGLDGRDVLSMPEQAKEIQTRSWFALT